MWAKSNGHRRLCCSHAADRTACSAQDLLPYMVRQQYSRRPFSRKQESNPQANSPTASQKLQQADSLTPGSQLVDVISSASKGTGVSGHRDMWCNAYVASKESYCGRVNTLQAYGEVNRYPSSTKRQMLQLLSMVSFLLVLQQC